MKIHSLRWYVVLIPLAALAALLIIFTVYRNNQTRVALCALRVDIDQRIAGSQDFLKKHPNGIPGLIPAGVIRVNIRNSQRTRKALDVLSC